MIKFTSLQGMHGRFTIYIKINGMMYVNIRRKIKSHDYFTRCRKGL